MNIDHKELASKHQIKQPKALRFAEHINNFLYTFEEDAKAIAAAADELVRLHSENETLQAGYAAARLEIQSLQARIKTMAEDHADELMVAHLDGRMREAQPAGAQQPDTAYADLMQAASDWICEHVQIGTIGATTWAIRLQSAAQKLRASHGQAPAQAAPAYKDSTPELQVGDSTFENWYSTYNPAHKGDKQRARDAYVAGISDQQVTAAPELTETAVTAKNPAAPVSSFEDSRTQAVYEVLVNDNYPPAGSNEHWEGWKARLIVDALFPIEAPAAVAGPSEALAPGKQHDDLFPPLPIPDLRDVGTTPKDIQDFLRGYATEYAKAALAAHATQPAPQQEPDEIRSYAAARAWIASASHAPADSVLEDAARYRWLRDVGGPTWVPFRIRTGYSAAQVDDAIDAARKQGANHD